MLESLNSIQEMKSKLPLLALTLPCAYRASFPLMFWKFLKKKSSISSMIENFWPTHLEFHGHLAETEQPSHHLSSPRKAKSLSSPFSSKKASLAAGGEQVPRTPGERQQSPL